MSWDSAGRYRGAGKSRRVVGAGDCRGHVWRGRAGAWAVAVVVLAGAQLLPVGWLPGGGLGVALASSPVPPPAPVNPAPRVVPVTAAGPTQVSGTLAGDTVWSPQGSPYLVSGQLKVPAGWS